MEENDDMNYSLDFSRITLDEYKDQLKKRNWIPSRKILQDQAEMQFAAFKRAQIKNMEQLYSIVSNRKKRIELLKNEDVSDEYLTVLLRELQSIQPKPLKLGEFNWMPEDIIGKIMMAGITNTKIMYEALGRVHDRKKFIAETSINEQVVVDLLKLSDLVRIQWVNPTFAHVLFAAGFDTVKKVSTADHEDLYRAVCLKNDELKLYKGRIGLNDMKLCVEAAKILPADLEV